MKKYKPQPIPQNYDARDAEFDSTRQGIALWRAVSWAMLAAAVAVAVYFFTISPEIMPTHFDFQGNIDGYGDRGVLFFTPGLQVFMLGITYLVLWLSKKNSDLVNTPVKMHAGNREVQLLLLARFIWVICAQMGLMFVALGVITGISGLRGSLDGWLMAPAMIVPMGLFAASVVRYVIQSRKYR